MTEDSKPFHTPFASLSGLRESLPQAPVSAPPVASKPVASATPATPAGKTIPRAVVRMERSGRGGKEVTVVEHLGLNPVDRDRWLKALKAALGCGGQVEDGGLVLQGDQRERLPKLLAARGVKKITVA
jgi:translation initiation factor 1